MPTLAAWMLLACVWHRRTLTARLVPMGQLEELGFTSWARERGTRHNKFDAPDNLFAPDPESHGRVLEAVRRAMHSGSRADAADAVAIGASHPDRLLRLCAQISALQFFKLRRQEVHRLKQWFAGEGALAAGQLDRALPGDRTLLEDQLEAILQWHLSGKLQANGDLGGRAGDAGRAPGLVLIHGTVFLKDQPEWSVPGRGLHEYIRQNLRNDVYGGSDYFQWAGGYSDHSRKMAAVELLKWIADRRLEGVDVVCHSHGGNVVLKATEMGASFGHVLLLSCPVSRQYALRKGGAITARSIRTKLDLTILSDGIADKRLAFAQKFPKSSGIVDEYLPQWFHHSKTTSPETWQRHRIRV